MTDDEKNVDVQNEGIVDTDIACGLNPVETGAWDPSFKTCKKHDLEDDAHMLGLPNDGLLETTTDFIGGEAEVEAKSLYGVVSAPVYAVVATIVNPFLWLYEGIFKRDPAKSGITVDKTRAPK